MANKNIQPWLEQTLRDALDPSHLEVINESHLHAVPKDSETHFKVVIVSSQFDGVSPVKRHQLVYGALGGDIKRIHALAITSRSPTEWESSPEANKSPLCHGGKLNEGL